jgi:hypothetical protein
LDAESALVERAFGTTEYVPRGSQGTVKRIVLSQRDEDFSRRVLYDCWA